MFYFTMSYIFIGLLLGVAFEPSLRAKNNWTPVIFVLILTLWPIPVVLAIRNLWHDAEYYKKIK